MRFLIAAATLVARALNTVFKAVLPVRHKAVFLSRQSDTPSKDFLLLAEELRRRDPNLEVVTRCRTLGEGLASRTAFTAAMIGQMYHLATAKVCVVDGYVVPVSLLDHRDSLFVVQMWHALGAIKKFGYQAVGRAAGRSASLASAMRMHRNYDLVLCGGTATVPIFASAFDVDESIVSPLGLPRIDYLLAHKDDAHRVPVPRAIVELWERFPFLAEPGRTTILYAPTFRKGAEPDYARVLERFSGDRFAVLVKPHPLQSAAVEGSNVANVGGYDVLDLLPICNAVITDYSAVAFEALTIDVPVYFYVSDIDAYRDDNGLNIDPLVEVPEIASRDLEGIARLIESGSFAGAAAERLRQRYLTAGEGGCTGRIADAIMRHTGGAVRGLE